VAWAAVATRGPLTPLPDPHFASALATYDGWTLASTVMPWRGCGNDPWGQAPHADRTARALDQLVPHLTGHRLIWGGDWNHAMSGREYAGSNAGRTHLLRAVEKLGLVVPTTELPHRIDGRLSIDHIAIPTGTFAARSLHIEATAEGRQLSDHEAYLVELTPR